MKKNLLIVLLLSLASVAQAESLSTYICKEELPFTEYDILRSRTVIKIQQVEDISSTTQEFDNAYITKVDISTEMENGSGASLLKSFTTISTSSDVYYQIESPQNGLSFHVYLDEMEESSASLTDSKGQQKKISLNCDYEESK